MLEIEKPKISIVDKSADGTYAKIQVEPLERGFGITVGNALRRSLLSALPGFAIKTITIEGVQHEFSTIEGVLEDTTDIILAIKSIKMKTSSKEDKVFRIEQKGEGLVTAGDIICDGDVEILNKDLVIATMEKDGYLNMELTAGLDRGYKGSEENKYDGMAIDEIAVDSIFSPVLRVNYEVKDKRVGKEADHDQLTMEIWTDGSITPEEAVSSASDLVGNHMALFTTLSSSDIAGVPLVERESKEIDHLLEKVIEELDFSVRPYNCLKRAGINTVGDLISNSEIQIMRVKNLGKKSLSEIFDKVAELGLSFKNEE